MGDTIDDYRALKHHLKEIKAERLIKNMEILRESGIPFSVSNGGYHVMFRHKGRSPVDFWPSTNKWRWRGRNYGGDARKLLRWYSGVEG